MSSLYDQLLALKEQGLTFGECVQAFAEPEDDPHVLAALRLHAVEGEVEVDVPGICSRGDDPGCYVMAWVWVDHSQASRFGYDWDEEDDWDEEEYEEDPK